LARTISSGLGVLKAKTAPLSRTDPKPLLPNGTENGGLFVETRMDANLDADAAIGVTAERPKLPLEEGDTSVGCVSREGNKIFVTDFALSTTAVFGDGRDWGVSTESSAAEDAHFFCDVDWDNLIF
jgi:hypothetical protein